ncbi:MAG: YhcH/YjgK/YiaL family protein [Fusobacteriaceae bacterium]
MIFDKLSNITQYKGISSNLDLAIDAILKGDYLKAEIGKHEVFGEEVFFNAMEYLTKNLEDCFFETHKKYLDIQMIVKGEENIGYSDIEELEITVPFNAEKDVEKQSGASQNIFKMKEDNFVIFFPEEPHMPCIKTNENKEIKKVVFKIKVN